MSSARTVFPFYDSSESPFNAVNLGTQTSVPGVSESEPSYTYVLNCPCGQMLKEPTEDAIVEVAQAHLRERHPDLADHYVREDILFMTVKYRD